MKKNILVIMAIFVFVLSSVSVYAALPSVPPNDTFFEDDSDSDSDKTGNSPYKWEIDNITQGNDYTNVITYEHFGQEFILNDLNVDWHDDAITYFINFEEETKYRLDLIFFRSSSPTEMNWTLYSFTNLSDSNGGPSMTVVDSGTVTDIDVGVNNPAAWLDFSEVIGVYMTNFTGSGVGQNDVLISQSILPNVVSICVTNWWRTETSAYIYDSAGTCNIGIGDSSSPLGGPSPGIAPEFSSIGIILTVLISVAFIANIVRKRE